MKAVILAAKLIVWLFYGLGGSWTSPGINQIGARLSTVPGVQVAGSTYYDAWQTVIPEMQRAPKTTLKALVGYSCGVGSTAWTAAQAGIPIAVIVGIQGSMFCPPTPLTPNIAAASETYNAACWETFGLGCATYTAGPGFPGSRITLIQRPDSHGEADIDPDAQNDVIRSVQAALIAKPKAALRESNTPRLVVRYHGE